MALIVEKRRMTDTSLDLSNTSSAGKLWCGNSEISDPRQTLTIPFTPIEKLRVTFPNMEDRLLQEALECCGGDLRTATCRLQKAPMMEGISVIEDEKCPSRDVAMRPKRAKKDLIQLFLDQLGRVTTKDEAVKLTELFLERYKEQKKANKEAQGVGQTLEKENKLLKRGMRILYERFNQMAQIFQREQEKTQELLQKEEEMQNELNYYKGLAGTLANKIREREEGYYTIIRSQFNPRPDIY